MHTQCRIAAVAILALAACTTPKPVGEYTPPDSKTETQIMEAAATPLSDLNIVRAEIPPTLLAALKDPYGRPADSSCTGIAAEIRALDAVLGADLDTPVTPINPNLIPHSLDALVQQGAGLASEAAMGAAVGAVRGAATSIVPYRSWVRKLSGAERYSKEVAAAIAAGGVRRSYLKGFGQATGCPVPAAPRG